MSAKKKPRKETPQRPQPSKQVDSVSSDSEEELELDENGGTFIDGIFIPPAVPPTLSFNPTGPRLIIRKIDNNFFKSYAKNEVLGPFHKCFNAIVGPNGSGKSNVIDSLLFVFGYRATKIRCKKVSVLLHDSEHYKNTQSCTVRIHFAQIIDKTGDNYDIVPGSEFVVSRTAHKDNSSYYELSGKRVQFKDIAILLKSHGIDLDHNRFLILQGEVEQIATMKCKGEKGESGLLEYLEDIIGTSRYKKPLGLVNEKVELLNEQRGEKLNRLNLVENELNELEEPMQEAVGFLKKENSIMINKNYLYQKNNKDIKEKASVEQERRDEEAKDQKQLMDQLKALEEQKKEHLGKQDEEGKIYENLKKRNESIKESIDKAKKKDVQLQEDMTNKNKQRKKTKELIVTDKQNLDRLKTVPQESENGIRELEGKLEKTTAQKERYEAEKSSLLKNIQGETKGLQEKKEEMQKDLAVLKESVDKTKSAFNLAETELKVCISNEETEKNKLANLKTLYETSAVTIQERTKQVAELNKKIPATKKALNEANVELLRVKQQETAASNEIRTKRGNLEEGRSSMQASKSRGRVLDSLMRAKTEGKCPGLFGRLGDLGAIDSKYDVAISTACGALDNIVVDTVDTAQWCIKFLKQHDIGRGVFIALDKQDRLRDKANSRIQTPENVHRLYDLVKIQDQRVKTAFYYGLSDTLVADDLEQASRIAYGARRYRVVTLKGDLIETTGTMSGGGKRVMKGRMGQSIAVANIDPRELNRLEQEVQELEVNVRELRARQAELEAQMNELNPSLRQMQMDLDKVNKELHSLQQQQPNLIRQIKEQEARSKATKSDAGQVKKLTAVVEQRKEEYEAAAETAGALQAEVDKITKEIKEKSGAKIRTVDKNIRECAKTIVVLKSEITKMTVAAKTAERNYKTTQENIARMEQDVLDMETALREMKAQREEIVEDFEKMTECMEGITQELKEREGDYFAAKKAAEEITKQENELKSTKIDIDKRVKDLDKKLQNYHAVIQSNEAKMSVLKLQEIPNEAVEELKIYTDEELEERDIREVEKEIHLAESHLKAAKPNLTAIQDYRKKQEVFMQRSNELEEINKKRQAMVNVYEDLKKRRKDEFTTGFAIIKLKLKEMYQMITLGGDAELELVDTYDPFTEGIQFNVRPPKKTWKRISNLSGGEKTLSSLALVFALHYYKPSPLYVMDEIDAALDFKNVSIVGNYIKERTKNAQFIIISLRSNMFELCDYLVGIYKTDNTTKSLTVDPRNFGQKPPQQQVVLAADQAKPSDNEANKENTEAENRVASVSTGPQNSEMMDTSEGPEPEQAGPSNTQVNIPENSGLVIGGSPVRSDVQSSSMDPSGEESNIADSFMEEEESS
ncbi:unnamed protein product [Ceutorhynchus assimilis]|uniref:Structural maintenance of chromosomes protein n=1 Tax=Ceutorhynchus assimilis TaxID=467358 RepID=A0A9N9MG05_9CUCU|nr:unnamed protein product [Ceutorhynchus assimilis]